MTPLEQRSAVHDNHAKVFRFFTRLDVAACRGLQRACDDCRLCECNNHVAVLDAVGRGVGDDVVCDDEALADEGIDCVAEGLLCGRFGYGGVDVCDEIL